MELDATSVRGRLYAAGRMLAGLDQAELATEAGLAPATISNVEAGRNAHEDTIKAVRKALRHSGVTVSIDRQNGLAIAAIRFDEPDSDD